MFTYLAEVDSGLTQDEPASPSGQSIEEVTAEMQNSTLESEPGMSP